MAESPSQTQKETLAIESVHAPVAPTVDGRRTKSATVDGEAFGGAIARYGLVLVLRWLGVMKVTASEANAMQGLVASSPLRSWTYGVFGVQTLSSLLGITLLAIARLIVALTSGLFPDTRMRL